MKSPAETHPDSCKNFDDALTCLKMTTLLTKMAVTMEKKIEGRNNEGFTMTRAAQRPARQLYPYITLP